MRSAAAAAALGGMFASLLGGAFGHARADEAPSGRAASLMPLAASDLILKSETIEFVFVPEQRAWRVAAHYELVNPTERALSVQLAVPEVRCSEDSEFDDTCDPTRGGFVQLEATLRDRTLRLRKGRVPRQPDLTAAETAWSLPVRLLAAESVPIDLHYVVPAGESSEGGWSADYLMQGSSLWAKPIGHATFKFSFSARSCLVVEPEHVTRKSRRVVMHADEPWLEVAYEAYVWIPPSDLTLYFEPCLAPRDTELPGCSAASELARFFYPAEANEEVEPIDEPALRAALTKLPDDELERCRNGVFTTYAGYFSEAELKKLPSHPESGRHYTAPLLTAADWAWVHFLDQRVAERAALREQRAAANRKAARPSGHGGCGCRSLALGRDVAGESGWWSVSFLLLVAQRRCRVRRT
jgi:hypothetical protein